MYVCKISFLVSFYHKLAREFQGWTHKIHQVQWLPCHMAGHATLVMLCPALTRMPSFFAVAGVTKMIKVMPCIQYSFMQFVNFR